MRARKYLITVDSDAPHSPITYTVVAVSAKSARAAARVLALADNRAWRGVSVRRA